MIYNFEFELEFDDDCCEFTIPVDSSNVETSDGYTYRVNIDAIVSPVLEGEKADLELKTDIQSIMESMIAESEDLADFRAEIDEAHGIVHEPDGIPTLYDINR